MASQHAEDLETYLLGVVEGRIRGFWPGCLRLLLSGLSLLFSQIVRMRLWLYGLDLLKPFRPGCQVISVGNLTVGGTGKTPVVETFARSLKGHGRKVAILSRGYRRKKRTRRERFLEWLKGERDDGTRVVSDGSEGSQPLIDSSVSGDEPWMLAKNLPGVAVLVNADRVASCRKAVRDLGCDTLVLDDGFQHLRLKHRMDIVLVDSTNPFGNGRMLPSGILREPIKNIKRADFIFITKVREGGAPDLKRQLRTLNPNAQIVECRHCPRFLQRLDRSSSHPEGQPLPKEDLAFLDGKRVVALSGIARPQGFEDELVRLGSTVMDHHLYADHHRYLPGEIDRAVDDAYVHNADMVVTTEKDAARFPELIDLRLPVYYLRVEIEMLDGEDQFDQWVSRVCFA